MHLASLLTQLCIVIEVSDEHVNHITAFFFYISFKNGWMTDEVISLESSHRLLRTYSHLILNHRTYICMILLTRPVDIRVAMHDTKVQVLVSGSIFQV